MFPKHFIQLVLLLFIFLVGLSQLHAQLIHNTYRHFTVHDGLPQQQVQQVLQDSRGYIWIGTKAGVSKYNGEYFENFTQEGGPQAGIIQQIHEDEQGYIWIFTYSGVAYYDGVSWSQVTDKLVESIFYSNGKYYGINYDDKNIYALIRDTMVVLANLERPTMANKFQPPVAYFPDFKEAAVGKFTKVAIDELGEVVRTDTLPSDFVQLSIPGGLSDNKYCLFANDGWFKFYEMGRKTLIDSGYFEKEFYPLLQAITYGADKSRMFVYSDEIIIKRDNKKQLERITMPSGQFRCSIIDQDGSIWIGSEKGLYQYFPGGFNYIDEKEAPMPWGVFEDSKGLIWIPSLLYGLKQYDGFAIKSIKVPGKPKPGIGPYRFYYGISEDHLGNLYFSTDFGWLKYSNGRWQNLLEKIANNQSGFTRFVLLNIFDSSRKKVLAGMQGGVYVYDPERNQLDSIVLKEIPQFITGMAIDNNDNWWFATARVGMAKYHVPSGEITYYHKNKNGVSLMGAWCIEPDPKGGLWFGSNDGLFYYSPEKDSFFQIPIFNKEVVFNLKVVDNKLMVGHINGLNILDLETFHQNGKIRTKALNQYNGFTGIEPNQNCAMLDSKGYYWVACSNQIAFIHKDQLTLDDRPSKVRIFEINEQRVPYTGKGEMQLTKGENEVTIRFESIGFQRPLRNQYSWRIPGFKDNWSKWSEDHTAFISHMPSGHYEFIVRSRHPGSEDSTAYITDSYKFQVSLPFYKEPHFYQSAFYGFGIAVVVGGLMVWRIRKSRKEILAAMKMAEEREKLIKYYQVQTLQAQLNPHFIFNLLETIQQYVEQQKRPEAVEQIQRLAKLLRRFLDSSINSDLESIGEGSKEINLNTEIELLTYYIELEQIQKPGMFQFSIAFEESLQPESLFVTPMIIQPFVENAIKRGLIPKQNPPRDLIVRFRPHQDGIRCTVEDTGIGMEASRQMQALSGRKYKPRGVNLVRERTELLKELGVVINIEVLDRAEGGTIVHIDFANSSG